jgi:hypothetical protein
MNKKTSCKHHRIPIYNEEELKTVDWLNQEINGGDIQAYTLLTRLAVKVVGEGRFYRETCPECQAK